MSEQTKILLATDLTFARPHPSNSRVDSVLRLVRDYSRRSIANLHSYVQGLGADGAYYMANRGSWSGWQIATRLLGEKDQQALAAGAIEQSWRSEQLRDFRKLTTQQKLIMAIYRHHDREIGILDRLRAKVPKVPITWQYNPNTLEYLATRDYHGTDDSMQIIPDIWEQLRTDYNGNLDPTLLNEHNIRLGFHIPSSLSGMNIFRKLALSNHPEVITSFEGTFGRGDLGQSTEKSIQEIQTFISGNPTRMTEQIYSLQRIGVKFRRGIIGVPLSTLATAIGSNQESALERTLTTMINRTRRLVE